MVTTSGITASPKAWSPEERALGNALVDGNPRTYEILNLGAYEDPCSFGVTFTEDQTIRVVDVDFASLGNRVYEPKQTMVHLEAQVNGSWQPLNYRLTRNYESVGALASYQGRGWGTWRFQFEPVRAKAIRLTSLASAHGDLGYRCIVPSRFACFDQEPTPIKATAEPYVVPEWLAPGADLGGGAQYRGGTFTWGRPMLIDTVQGTSIQSIEYLVRDDWRKVSGVQKSTKSWRFTPVATTALRVKSQGKPKITFSVEGRKYFEAVQGSRFDLLGDRFRKEGYLDLASMESLLLPIDFPISAIGRPADLHETLVAWTGAFVMVDTSTAEDVHGRELPLQSIDRWFMPIYGGKPLAENVMTTQSKPLNGWMPGTVTTNGVLSQTLYVTAPGAPLYANVAELKLKGKRKGTFGFALGRRCLYNQGDQAWSPFASDPMPTGYTLDKDGQTVRNKTGEIVFWSSVPGKLGGTPYEAHFEVESSSSQSEMICLMPSVDEPIKSLPKDLNLGQLRKQFETYWTKRMDQAFTVDVPEKPFNDLIRNLLAQSLIITLDGDAVRYGAYFYESYFGIEEGWPAVALAQFGFAEEAKTILRTMLRPAFMSKAEYHHQYRNGLDPWYAITIGRLTQDAAWLKEIWPISKECADWTLKVTGENKDPNWGGTLPKHIYGGDIGMPAYSYYSNATCWRGLNDTAWLAAQVGEKDAAKIYEEGAKAYHRRLIELADKLKEKVGNVTFLPMSFDLDTPSGHREKEPAYPFLATHTNSGDTWGYVGNYWNLFAPVFLEVRLFHPEDPRSRWIPDYMEQRGGILTGMARFDLGYDAIYGKGYMESLLEMGRREEFLTSLYGMIAHGMSRNQWSCPEVSGIFPLRVDNRTMYREYERERWTWMYRPIGAWLSGWMNQEGEPLSAGPGMTLQLIRTMLVREDTTLDPPKRLILMDGVPHHWIAKGKHIEVRQLRTFFGNVSFRMESFGDRLKLTITAPEVPLSVHFPLIKNEHINKVTINGARHTAFTKDSIQVDKQANDLDIDIVIGR